MTLTAGQAGSALTAGNNLSVTATGVKGNGDITLEGSALQAGKDVRLDAARDLNLVSSTDTHRPIQVATR